MTHALGWPVVPLVNSSVAASPAAVLTAGPAGSAASISAQKLRSPACMPRPRDPETVTTSMSVSSISKACWAPERHWWSTTRSFACDACSR